jgi:hypothetical protein
MTLAPTTSPCTLDQLVCEPWVLICSLMGEPAALFVNKLDSVNQHGRSSDNHLGRFSRLLKYPPLKSA